VLNRLHNKIAHLGLMCRKSFKLEPPAVHICYDLLRALVAVEVWDDGDCCDLSLNPFVMYQIMTLKMHVSSLITCSVSHPSGMTVRSRISE
jgi:hypothetical protein